MSSLGFTCEAGAIAKIKAEMKGLLGDRTATTKASHTPDYEDVSGLVGFNVEVYFGNNSICGNKVELTIENEISDKKSYCTEKGKTGAIVRKRSIAGSVNPYIDGSTTFYDALGAQTDFSVKIFIGAKNSSGFIVGQTMGIYLPQVMITQDKTGDIDDNIIEDINFTAHTGSGGTSLDLVWSFG